MDHSRVPAIEAPQAFRERGDVVYGPPGHMQGRGADPRVIDVVGDGGPAFNGRPAPDLRFRCRTDRI
jgi:hypothetical protein